MTVRPVIGNNLPNGFVIGQTEWNRDVVQQGNYMQEVIAGSNTDKIPLAALAGVAGFYPNLLTNGGLEVWQRGTSFSTASGQGIVGPDGWRLGCSTGATLTAGRGVGQVGALGGQYYCFFNYTHVAGGNGVFYQNVENPLAYRGATVAFTAMADLSAGGARGYLIISDGTGDSYSNIAVAGTRTALTVTRVISASATTLRVTYALDTASCSANIDHAMLTLSTTGQPYSPAHPADDLLRCLRYYQQVRVSTRWYPTTAGQNRTLFVPLPVEMASNPTVATIAAGSAANIASRTLFPGNATYCNTKSCMVQYLGNAANADTYSFDDVVTLETA